MIAILAAMDQEVEALKELMTDVEQKDIKGLDVYFGKLSDKEIVLSKSGVGKVESAVTATIIIQELPVDYLINIGSSGSLKEEMPIGSVIIPTVLNYHDLEVEDWPKNFKDERHTFYPDQRLLDVAKKLKDDKTFFKPHVTGDMFVYKKEQIAKIIEEFPTAYSTEMEAAAIANACTILKVPFIIIRSISDLTIKEGSEIDYDLFLPVACKNSALYCQKFIKEVNNEYNR